MSLCRFDRQIIKDVGYSAAAIAQSAFDNFACLPRIDAQIQTMQCQEITTQVQQRS